MTTKNSVMPICRVLNWLQNELQINFLYPVLNSKVHILRVQGLNYKNKVSFKISDYKKKYILGFENLLTCAKKKKIQIWNCIADNVCIRRGKKAISFFGF